MAELNPVPTPEDASVEEVGRADAPHLSDAFLASLVHDLKEKDRDAVRARVCDLHAADLADILALLTGKQRKRMIKYMGDEIDPELFHEVDGVVQDDLYEVAGNQQIAEAVTELETDDAVYVLEELGEEDREEVLDAIPEAERQQIESCLAYPEETAGRMMQRDLLALPEFWSVGQAIDHLRSGAENIPLDFYDIFVVDPAHKLSGTVPLSRVMRAARDMRLSDLMNSEVRMIDALADQEEVAYQFNQYHLISAPVVDENARLLGVITVDDVIEVVGEEAEEDILALAGVSDGSVRENFRETAHNRLSWLGVNLMTAIMASLVIGIFDATIEQMVALAILMPVVASMGGNAGTQTMTVAVRAIATKELDQRNMLRVLWRETAMAALNGFVLAIFSAMVVLIWFGDQQLALVFAIGMVITIVIAGLSGLLIPFGLHRAGIDPAIASSVFVTTITDTVGFFAFLGLAAVMIL